MLPILFSITLQPSLAPFVLFGIALATGAWQIRVSRVAGESWQKAVQAGALWAAGTAGLLFVAVRALGDPGNNNVFALTRPLVVPLHTYGLLIATAFLVAMTIAGRAAQREGQDRDRVMDLTFWILVAAMIGSRVLFILVNWDDYARDPASIFAFWKGGLVFYGGFIGAVLISIWYMRKHRMPFFPVADVLIPSVALGHAIGRLGCFAAGCCWGGACDPHLPWAAKFPPESLAYQSQVATGIIHLGAAHTIPIHPTQLYESLGELLIFCALIFWRQRKRFHGELLALYLVLYAPLRAMVETLRGDEERGRVFNFVGPWAKGAWWNLSTSELISVGIFAAGIALFAYLGRRRPMAATA
ncbi:MAG: prolipoprotein diacylglyceryl transferase [Myxococcales bacterium]